MTRIKPHILINTRKSAGGTADLPNRRFDGTGLEPHIQPPNILHMAHEAELWTWDLQIEGIWGTPPANWSLTAQFLDVIESLTGPQYTGPALVPFPDVNVPFDIVEGVGPHGPGRTPPVGGAAGVIVDQTTNWTGVSPTNPIRVRRTVHARNLRHKIELKTSWTTGDFGLFVYLSLTPGR